MQSQLQIALEDVPPSGRLNARIMEKVGKLEKICPRLAACRVAVSAPPRREESRRLFTVQLSITFPGGEVVLKRNHHEDVFVVLRDAFVAGRRALDRCAWRSGTVEGRPEGCGCRDVAGPRGALNG